MNDTCCKNGPEVGCRKSFQRGLGNNSFLVLLVAALIAFFAMLGLQSLFTSGVWSELPMHYWLRDTHDDFVAVSWTVGRLKRHPDPKPLLVFLGGSGAREAVSNNETLAGAVAFAGGPPVTAYDLGSSSQNFAEALAIVDNLPNRQATLLVGVNINSFVTDRNLNFQQMIGRELLLESNALNSYAEERYGIRHKTLGIYPGIFNFLRQYTRQHFIGFLHGKPFLHDYNQHVYDTRVVLTPRQKADIVEKWLRTTRQMFHANYALNAALLEEIVKVGKKRGFEIVLVELPTNESVTGKAFAPETERYRAGLSRIAATYSVSYLDFNSQLPLASDHFYDLSHLLLEGRTIWERALAENLVAMGCFGAVGGGAR